MFLDGDKVNVGDMVFHITGGYGKVVTIQDGSARVKMDSGGILNMSNGGFSGVRKTFFWYAPHFLTPRKGKGAIQAKAIEIAEKVVQMLEVKDAG